MSLNSASPKFRSTQPASEYPKRLGLTLSAVTKMSREISTMQGLTGRAVRPVARFKHAHCDWIGMIWGRSI